MLAPCLIADAYPCAGESEAVGLFEIVVAAVIVLCTAIAPFHTLGLSRLFGYLSQDRQSAKKSQLFTDATFRLSALSKKIRVFETLPLEKPGFFLNADILIVESTIRKNPNFVYICLSFSL